MKLRIHRYDGSTEVVQSGSEVAQNPVKTAQEVAQGLAQTVAQSGSDSGSDSGLCRIEPVRAMRNAGIITPLRVFMNVLSLTAVVVACGLTVCNSPGAYQAIAYLISIAGLILLDPFRAITKFLAPQTRVLLAIDFLMIVPAIVSRNSRYIGVITVLIILSGVLIRLMNKSWLYLFNWFMSDSARKAVTKNPDGKGYQSWINSGKREARVILSECGYSFTEKILDSYGLSLYLCGFYAAYRKNTKLKNSVSEAYDQIDNVLAYAEELEEQNSDLTDQNDDLTEQLRIQSEDDQEQLDSYRASCQNLKNENARLLEMIRRLQKANEELTASIPEPSAVADVLEGLADDLDSRILHEVQINAELRERGEKFKGYRVIAQEFNVTKGYIDRLVKSQKEKAKVVQFPEQQERKEVCL